MLSWVLHQHMVFRPIYHDVLFVILIPAQMFGLGRLHIMPHTSGILRSENADITSVLLPLAEMVHQGDEVYIGRYLVSGADTASLFLKVSRTGR